MDVADAAGACVSVGVSVVGIVAGSLATGAGCVAVVGELQAWISIINTTTKGSQRAL